MHNKKNSLNSVPGDVYKNINELDIYRFYSNSPYYSSKHVTYFQVYADLLESYRHKSITFVEIGVQNGGSLFMWRDYLGRESRIIGIDLNPKAKQFEQYGFDICIGDQSRPGFWEEFFVKYGGVDVVLDDGGHTNEQQIVTAHHCIPKIRDGGMMIVEDVHTSYLKRFGNPSKYSFIEWSKKLVDHVNTRCGELDDIKSEYSKAIYSVSFYESIVCFKVDRRKCIDNYKTNNGGINDSNKDFRRTGSLYEKINIMKDGSLLSMPGINRQNPINKLRRLVFDKILFVLMKVDTYRLKKYFE